LLGLTGLPDQIWKRGETWLDHYVKDKEMSPKDDWKQLMLLPFDSRREEYYESWVKAVSTNVSFRLEREECMKQADGSEDNVDTGDVEDLSSLTTGKYTLIHGGVAFVSATVRAEMGISRHFRLPFINRKYACVWQSDVFDHDVKIRGMPSVLLNILPQV
jgi:hypothetical protein